MAEVLILGALLIALFVWAMHHLGNQGELAWLPKELRQAQLAYAEELFRVTGSVVLTAKVDRGYRTLAGIIILLELKCRQQNRVYRSDIIELSAQRVALMVQMREEVALYAYVVVQGPSGYRAAHRVGLIDVVEVDALISRREAILAGSISPRPACNPLLCRGCWFKQRCVDELLDAGVR